MRVALVIVFPTRYARIKARVPGGARVLSEMHLGLGQGSSEMALQCPMSAMRTDASTLITIGDNRVSAPLLMKPNRVALSGTFCEGGLCAGCCGKDNAYELNCR